MKIITSFILILITIIALTSCGRNNTKSVRAYKMYYTTTGEYKQLNELVHFIEVDTAAKPGDIVNYETSVYIIENKTGNCTYEGGECPNAQHYMRDYQLEYHDDTLWLYSGDRLVGMDINSTDGINHGAFLDSTVLKDNL